MNRFARTMKNSATALSLMMVLFLSAACGEHPTGSITESEPEGPSTTLAFEEPAASEAQSNLPMGYFCLLLLDSEGRVMSDAGLQRTTTQLTATISVIEGNGTLSGTLTQPVINGSVVFDDLVYSGTGLATFEIVVSGMDVEPLRFSVEFGTAPSADDPMVPLDVSSDDILAVSNDGRYVSYLVSVSRSSSQIYLYDRQTDTSELISVSVNGEPANGGSVGAVISDNGRFVAFESNASDLISNDTNNTYDVFVRDRLTLTTRRVSQNASGAEGDNASWAPVISGDGRYIEFYSQATNLTGTYTEGINVFIHDQTNRNVTIGSEATRSVAR